MSSKLVLIAIPEQWDEELSQLVEKAGFSTIKAYSYADALEIVQSQDLMAVVMTSDWAINQDDGSVGLIKHLKGKTPTYSLITKTTYQTHFERWMDELFEPPRHEYQHMPADVDAVIGFLKNA